MAAQSRATLRVDTLEDLRDAPVEDASMVIVIGRMNRNDGMGAFYQWSAAATDPEDTAFFNVIPSRVSSTGRWLRVAQRARARGATDYLILSGGVRTLFAYGATDANGEVTVYLTEDGSATGSPIFGNVWMTVGQATTNAATPNDIVTGARKSLAADLKSVTYRFARGNSQTLGNTLAALLGTVITGFRVPPTGTPVIIRIDGV